MDYKDSNDRVSSLDLIDQTTASGWHFVFPPLPPEDNPLYVSEFDDETFDTRVLPILGRLQAVLVEPVVIPGSSEGGKLLSLMAHLTDESVVLTPIAPDIVHDPFIGQVGSTKYRAAQVLIAEVTPLQSLVVLARKLRGAA